MADGQDRAVWCSVLVIAALCFGETEGRPQLKGGEQAETLPVAVLAGVAGVVALVVAVALCAEKKVNPSVKRSGPPEWTSSLVFKDELNTGFGDTSDGLHTPTPFHVIRERLGNAVTDAARWTCPLQHGKHVFEVYWPIHKNRGHACCIGVGSEDVGLRKHGRCSLVGEHSQSWGLDLARRRAIHLETVQTRLSLGIPDRFFVYLDLDSGKIGFGDDVGMRKNDAEFYGYICHGIPKNKIMYLMISMCAPNEQVHCLYRGTAVPSGGFNLLDVASPLQLSMDNNGKTYIIPYQPGPPTYMAATGTDQQPPAPVHPFQAAQETTKGF